MGKHLVDIDETALAAAQAELGTASMKDTVNEALRRATVRRNARVQKALDRLGERHLLPREEAWALTHMLDTSVVSRLGVPEVRAVVDPLAHTGRLGRAGIGGPRGWLRKSECSRVGPGHD